MLLILYSLKWLNTLYNNTFCFIGSFYVLKILLSKVTGNYSLQINTVEQEEFPSDM